MQKEALARFKEDFTADLPLPDFIFLDIGLGAMNGWQFIEALQEHLVAVKTRPDIFILSAFTNTEDRKKAQEHQLVAGYFDKPLTRSRLEKILEEKL